MQITPLQVREVFGNPAPPDCIWEAQFDGFDEKLAEIGKKDWHLVSEADLWYYLHDLSHMELQPDLFAHLFPVCLNFWYDTLVRNEAAERGDAEFHKSLHRGQILTRMVTAEQRQFIHDFMVYGLLDRIESERGFIYRGRSTPAYGWMSRLNSVGIIVPIVGRIWEAWWRLDHPGKAVSAVMWASGLVYKKGENPIFGEWNGQNGGGGPYLIENDSQIYDAAWLKSNLDFLRTTVDAAYIQTKLVQAADALRGEPEHHAALEVARQAQEWAETIDERIKALFHGLSTPLQEILDCFTLDRFDYTADVW